MKKGLFLLAIILGIGHLTATMAMSAGTLRFVILPRMDQATALRQFQPMVDYLERRLETRIHISWSDDETALIATFKQSPMDLVYLGPASYVRLRAASAYAAPLIRFRDASGEDTDTCSLVTFPDAVFDPQFAQDRRIVLAHPADICGYPAAARLMTGLGSDIRKNRYQYIGKMADVPLSIIRGEADAGSVKTAVARKYVHMGLEILSETEKLPGFVLAGDTRTLGPEMMHRVQVILTSLSPDSPDAGFLKNWGEDIRYGSVPAKDSDFDGVRELLKTFPVPLEDH